MINVFIDANIWLSLYDFSSDDLEQFRKLRDLIDVDVKILLPEQVRNEVYRNRENKIKDVLRQFGKWTFQIPNICKGYDDYQEFLDLIKQLQNKHRKLIKEIEQDIVTNMLHADTVIDEIFKKSNIIKNTNDIINRAVLRYNIGNPPGKEHKYGDAINWLTLIANSPENEDIFFISADQDYRSALDDNRFNQYLKNEWKKEKRSELHFYKSLTDFFSKHLSDIELKAESTKNQLIKRFSDSGSFATTHRLIKQLSEYSSWTYDQVKDICRAVRENNQILQIINDEDVLVFLKNVINNCCNKNDDDIVFIKNTIENNESNEADDDYPF